MKKTLACVLASMMILSVGMTANAATIKKSSSTTSSQQAKDSSYELIANNKEITIINGRKTIGSYTLKSSRITLAPSTDKGIALQFTDEDSKAKTISLGSATELTVTGKLTNLLLKDTLPSDTKITLDSAAKITSLKVSSASTVTINGTVDAIDITEATAKVTASQNAIVNKVTTVSSKAISGVSSDLVRLTEKETTTGADASKEKKTIHIYNLNVNADGGVTFECDIKGADVIVNGSYIGTTKAGKNSISVTTDKNNVDLTMELEMEGYISATADISPTGFFADDGK